MFHFNFSYPSFTIHHHCSCKYHENLMNVYSSSVFTLELCQPDTVLLKVTVSMRLQHSIALMANGRFRNNVIFQYLINSLFIKTEVTQYTYMLHFSVCLVNGWISSCNNHIRKVKMLPEMSS